MTLWQPFFFKPSQDLFLCCSKDNKGCIIFTELKHVHNVQGMLVKDGTYKMRD